MSELKDKLLSQKQAIENKLLLFDDFPDLKEKKSRWASHLCSKVVNTQATAVEFRHGCGCCCDSPLYAMPYVVKMGIRIYSDPPQICVGEKAGQCADGERPDEKWEEELTKHGISQDIIELVQQYFESNPVKEYDDDEDDEEDND